VSLVLFEVTAGESAGLPADVRSRVRLEPRTLHESAADHSDCEMAIVEVRSTVGAAELDRLPRLRTVVSRTAGLDHIDVEACAERGVAVTHAGEYSSAAVAEFTIALLLHLLRGGQIRGGALGALGGELSGRTVGVVGFGGIGHRVAIALTAMGCKVLVVTRRSIESVETASLEQVLERASVITLHLPGEAGLVLGSEQFHRLNRGALLVNTARACLIDHDALIAALASGRVGGAALDVGPWETDRSWLEREDVRGLLADGRLAVTDHVAWATEAAFERQLRCVTDAVRAWEG